MLSATVYRAYASLREGAEKEAMPMVRRQTVDYVEVKLMIL